MSEMCEITKLSNQLTNSFLISHRNPLFARPLRDDSTGAAVAPGAPKKAARPVDVNPE